jgi:benzoate/toluate 1,2-dioxygenase beta subunit
MDGIMTLLAEVEDLLYQEARLLDERQFERWLALYAKDAVYWIPASWGQQSITDDVSLFHDDRMTLAARVGRLLHPRAHAQLPPSRTLHVVTNIRLAGEQDGLVCVHSACVFHEFRAPDRLMLAAQVEHRLRREGGVLRIVRKRVDLLECDQPHRSLQIPI